MWGDAGAAMDKLGEARPWSRRQRRRSPWAMTGLALAMSLAGLVCLGLIIHSLNTRQLDPKGCRMSYMRPSYARLDDFDTEHTRFASKYSLYLYREQGIDDETKLRGIPVLFIPGNAGSYKQVRPIAAEAANHFHDVLQHDERAVKDGVRPLDFFTVDFNEDFTAFHGQTLLDQAEYLNEAVRYILSLYLDPRMAARGPGLPDPAAAMVLGHSMGGIVARTMLVMPNYQANSINTIVTMSAPHARPPVSFDSQIVDTYAEINAYWRRAYSQQWAANNPLWHVTLISIAGGGLDTVVPSDYSSVESLVPETHGFTVFTSTIPTVWTSMDHQAIMWCDQFRKVVARALYDVVDARRPSQTKPRAERIRFFRRRFLTGMEDDAERTLSQVEINTLLTLDDASDGIVAQGERLVLRELGMGGVSGGGWRPQAHLLPVPPPGSPVGARFTLLTDQELSDGSGRLEVLFCSVFPASQVPGQAGTAAGSGSPLFTTKMDLSGDSGGATRLACKSAASDVILLPPSTRSARHPFTVDGERLVRPFSYLQYELEDIATYQFLAVVDKAVGPTPGFVIAEFSDRTRSRSTRHVSLSRLLAFGVDIQLPPTRAVVTDVRIPSVRSALLAYNLDVSGPLACNSESGGGELFTPLVRQHITEPHESKFFVNVRRAAIGLHGVAPYVPPPLRRPRTTDEDGLGLQFWTDPTCASPVHIRLRVDVLGSMGKLYMRYRTVFAAFPLLVVALVLRKQFHIYDASGVFIPFAESLGLCLRRSIPLMLLALTALSLSSGSGGAGAGAPGHEPLSPNFSYWRNATTVAAIDFHQNDLLVGTGDPFFWFMIPLIGLVCIGACTVLNYVALALTWILSSGMYLLSIQPSWNGVAGGGNFNHGPPPGPSVGRGVITSSNNNNTTNGNITQININSNASGRRASYCPCPTFYSFNPCSPRRRLVTTAVLLLLVSTFIPYQFAYVVACLVQLSTTVRALRIASDSSSSSSSSSSASPSSSPGGASHSHNFCNYVHSVLVLMLWILPINLPTLVVWVRNLALHWLTPFSSHHNVLSILPFLVLVETHTTGRMVPRVTSRLRHLTGSLFLGIAVAAAVYGVSHAYVLHHTVNLVAAWLVLIHSTTAVSTPLSGKAAGSPVSAAATAGGRRRQGSLWPALAAGLASLFDNVEAAPARKYRHESPPKMDGKSVKAP